MEPDDHVLMKRIINIQKDGHVFLDCMGKEIGVVGVVEHFVQDDSGLDISHPRMVQDGRDISHNRMVQDDDHFQQYDDIKMMMPCDDDDLLAATADADDRKVSNE